MISKKRFKEELDKFTSNITDTNFPMWALMYFMSDIGLGAEIRDSFIDGQKLIADNINFTYLCNSTQDAIIAGFAIGLLYGLVDETLDYNAN